MQECASLGSGTLATFSCVNVVVCGCCRNRKFSENNNPLGYPLIDFIGGRNLEFEIREDLIMDEIGGLEQTLNSLED